ncbi:MAG TPA: 1,4-alpha-glucan branching protein domain-containing protein [Opitutaceae bacterium]|nr:1,4-alpha-glucan branching protein domain-containing protein [Opitutaceae bacterium]
MAATRRTPGRIRPAAPRRLAILLHAHLPDCRRPDDPASLEETWFFEALTESYLPLIRMLDRLARDGIAARLTLSLSPTLLGMLADPALRERYRRRLAATAELAARDARDSSGRQRELAEWHAQFFRETGECFDDRCRGDVLKILGEHWRAGLLELATTAATHAFLPAHQAHPPTVRAQIGVGLDAFAGIFGFRPDFYWLPECGYNPGLEDLLGAGGVRVFGLESHGVTQAEPPPPRGVRAPVRCPGGALVLGRDAEISRRVWSASEGYPGHPVYREFHRDRIQTLDAARLAGWPGAGAHRLPAGLKYWRVTGATEDKDWYDPATAAARARLDAQDFVRRLAGAADESGLWFAPFDAELFGHWWFEGPLWLEEVFRLLARETTVVAATATAAAEGAEAFAAQPAASSWGERGDNSYWVNRETAWLYPQLDAVARRFEALLARWGGAPAASPEGRALRQAARALLLAQASDWPFLIRAGTAADAAAAHVTGLLARFATLCDGLESGAVDEATLRRCEQTDLAFPNLDLRWFEAH